MKNRFCSLASFTSAALLAGSALAQDEPRATLTPDDFAYAIELTSSDVEPVQTVLVPLAVYRTALRPDLGDVRVFNAAGQQLPHAIRKLAPPPPVDQPIAERERSVALFPLLGPADAPAGALDKLALRIERGASGSVINIESTPEAATATRVVAYVLDTQAIDRDMLSLRLRIEEASENAGQSYLAPVAIDASDDLTRWYAVVPDGTLARLSHNGQLVTRDRIELPDVRAKFLRVRATGRADVPGKLAEAWVELAQTEVPAPQHESLRARGHASSEPGVFDYDLGGAFPVEQLRVLLPSTGTLIQAEVSVAAASGETEAPEKVSAIRARTSKRIYDDVFDGPIYRLSEAGKELESPPIELSGRRVRYVSITVGEGAMLEDAPELEIAYAPAQLLFVPRPPAPYSLAYGSHVAAPSKMTADALLAPFSGARARLPAATAQVGATSTLSGEAALRAPPPPPPIKTYVLWGVLIAGTLAVTGLAIRLIRKLDN